MNGDTAGFPGKNLVAPFWATTSLKSWFLAILTNLTCCNDFEIWNLDFLPHFLGFLQVSAQTKIFCIIFWTSPNSIFGFLAILTNLKCVNDSKTSYLDFLLHFWRFLEVSAQEKIFCIIFWTSPNPIFVSKFNNSRNKHASDLILHTMQVLDGLHELTTLAWLTRLINYA